MLVVLKYAAIAQDTQEIAVFNIRSFEPEALFVIPAERYLMDADTPTAEDTAEK